MQQGPDIWAANPLHGQAVAMLALGATCNAAATASCRPVESSRCKIICRGVQLGRVAAAASAAHTGAAACTDLPSPKGSRWGTIERGLPAQRSWTRRLRHRRRRLSAQGACIAMAKVRRLCASRLAPMALGTMTQAVTPGAAHAQQGCMHALHAQGHAKVLA